MRMKNCSTCKITKLLIEFSKNKSRKGGYAYECKSCVKQYQIKNVDKKKDYDKSHWKKYYQQNSIALNQHKSEYVKTEHGKLMCKAKNHKRRILKLQNTPTGNHWTAQDIKLKLKLQYGKCIYCNTSIKDYYEIDHIMPLIKGGSNEAWNIQLLCKDCNRGIDGKGTKLPHEFAQQHGKLI